MNKTHDDLEQEEHETALNERPKGDPPTVLARVAALLKTLRGDGDDQIDRMRLTTAKILRALPMGATIKEVRAAVKALHESKDVSMRHNPRGNPAYMWRNDKDRAMNTERKAIEQRAQVLAILIGIDDSVVEDGLGHYVMSQEALQALINTVAKDPGRVLRAVTLPFQPCTGTAADKPCPHGPAPAAFMSEINAASRATCCHCMDEMRHLANKAGQTFAKMLWRDYRANGL